VLFHSVNQVFDLSKALIEEVMSDFNK